MLNALWSSLPVKMNDKNEMNNKTIIRKCQINRSLLNEFSSAILLNFFSENLINFLYFYYILIFFIFNFLLISHFIFQVL